MNNVVIIGVLALAYLYYTKRGPAKGAVEAALNAPGTAFKVVLYSSDRRSAFGTYMTKEQVKAFILGKGIKSFDDLRGMSGFAPLTLEQAKIALSKGAAAETF